MVKAQLDQAADEQVGSHGYIHRKDDYLKRLSRIEGQARGLQRMVDEEKVKEASEAIARLVRS